MQQVPRVLERTSDGKISKMKYVVLVQSSNPQKPSVKKKPDEKGLKKQRRIFSLEDKSDVLPHRVENGSLTGKKAKQPERKKNSFRFTDFAVRVHGAAGS